MCFSNTYVLCIFKCKGNYSNGPYEYKDCLLCYGLLLFQRDLKMRKNLGCFAIKSVDLRF